MTEYKLTAGHARAISAKAAKALEERQEQDLASLNEQKLKEATPLFQAKYKQSLALIQICAESAFRVCNLQSSTGELGSIVDNMLVEALLKSDFTVEQKSIGSYSGKFSGTQRNQIIKVQW